MSNITPDAAAASSPGPRVYTAYTGDDGDYAEAVAHYIRRNGDHAAQLDRDGVHHVYVFIGFTEPQVDVWMHAERQRLALRLPDDFRPWHGALAVDGAPEAEILPVLPGVTNVTPGTFAEVIERARADADGMTLLQAGEPLYEATPADRRYPGTGEAVERVRVVTDLYEWDGEQLHRRRYFRDFTDDAIDLAFVHLAGEWGGTGIANMLTIGDGLLMVGRGAFVYAGHDGDDVVFTPAPRPLFGV